MYYKAKLNSEIVDALDHLQCVRYYADIDRILRMSDTETEKPQGIISSDGQYIWQASVDGSGDQWDTFPEDAKGKYSGTVVLYEIDAEEYKTIRDLLDEGSTPTDPEPEPDPEPSTDEETLEWAKKTKIAISKAQLAEYLEQHPITSSAHSGVPGVYSVTEEKQQLMALNYSTYQIKKAAGLNPVLTWNETGKECEEWTETEFVQLIIEIEAYVKPLISAQQSYEQQLQDATTLKEVDEVEIIY